MKLFYIRVKDLSAVVNDNKKASRKNIVRLKAKKEEYIVFGGTECIGQ